MTQVERRGAHAAGAHAKPPAKKSRKGVKILAIVACSLLALCLMGAVAAFALVKAGENALHEASRAEEIQTTEEAVTYDKGRTVEHDGHMYALNENMVSVVVIGYDKALYASNQGAGQADAVMVLALDTQTGKATAIGIPRDSMVDVSEFVGEAFIGQDIMQLCLAFSYGSNADEAAEYTTTAVSRLLYNMPMSYYMAMNYDAVAPLVNAVGGIAVTALETVPPAGVVEGQDATLYDEAASQYVRWRDTSAMDSSLKRQARQVQFVKTFSSQALASAKGDVGVLLGLYDTASQYSVTNLGVSEFSYLATALVSAGVTSLDVVTLEGELAQGPQYVEYHLDKDFVYQTVLDVYYTQVD